VLAGEVDRAFRDGNGRMQAGELAGGEYGGLAAGVSVAEPALGLAAAGEERLDPGAVNVLEPRSALA
jgi:hypothetical protein